MRAVAGWAVDWSHEWTGLPPIDPDVEHALREACGARKQGLDALSEGAS